MNDINYILRPTLLSKLKALFDRGLNETEIMGELRVNFELRSFQTNYAIVLALKGHHFEIADTLNALEEGTGLFKSSKLDRANVLSEQGSRLVEGVLALRAELAIKRDVISLLAQFAQDEDEPFFIISSTSISQMMLKEEYAFLATMISSSVFKIRMAAGSLKRLRIINLLNVVNQENFPLGIWTKTLSSIYLYIEPLDKDIQGLATQMHLCPTYRHKLIEPIFSSRNYTYKGTHFLLCLNTDLSMVAYELFQKHKTEIYEDQLIRSRIPTALNRFLSFGDFLEVKIYIARHLLSYYQAKDIKDFLETQVPLALNRNPIKSIILLSEFVMLMQKRFSQFKEKCEEYLQRIQSMASAFIEDINDDYILKEIILEQDLEGRSGLELLSKYQITSILDKLERIVLNVWNGQLSSHSSFFQMSKLAQRAGFYREKKRESLPHPYQFNGWIHSMQWRYYGYILCLFFLAILFQYSIGRIMTIFTEMVEPGTIFFQQVEYASTGDPAFDLNLYLSLFAELDKLYGDGIFWIRISTYFSFALSAQMLFIPITYKFYQKTGRKFFFPIEHYTTLVHLALQLYVSQSDWRFRFGSIPGNNNLEKMGTMNQVQFMEDAYSIIVGTVWLRLILGLKVTRLLGPIINIVFKMLKDVAVFLVLFMLVLILFTCMGQISFSTIQDFSTFFQAFKTLYSSALGDFDISAYPEKAAIFMMAYLLVNLVLMLNLLIALLSNTYTVFERKSLALYLKDVVNRYDQFKYDAWYGGANPKTYPWTAPVLILGPILLCSRSKCLNRCILQFQYLFHFVIYLTFFLAFESVFVPLAWFKQIRIHLTNLSYQKAGTKRCCEYFWLSVVYLFFGVLLEIAYVFIDGAYFTRDAFSAVSIEKFRNTYKLQMNEKNFQKTLKIIDDVAQRTKSVDYEMLTREIILQFRHEFGFKATFDEFIDIIQDNSCDNTELTQIESNEGRQTRGLKSISLKEYNSLKDFIFRNSIEVDPHGNLILYPKIFNHILQETHFMKSVAIERKKVVPLYKPKEYIQQESKLSDPDKDMPQESTIELNNMSYMKTTAYTINSSKLPQIIEEFPSEGSDETCIKIDLHLELLQVSKLRHIELTTNAETADPVHKILKRIEHSIEMLNAKMYSREPRAIKTPKSNVSEQFKKGDDIFKTTNDLRQIARSACKWSLSVVNNSLDGIERLGSNYNTRDFND